LTHYKRQILVPCPMFWHNVTGLQPNTTYEVIIKSRTSKVEAETASLPIRCVRDAVYLPTKRHWKLVKRLICFLILKPLYFMLAFCFPRLFVLRFLPSSLNAATGVAKKWNVLSQWFSNFHQPRSPSKFNWRILNTVYRDTMQYHGKASWWSPMLVHPRGAFEKPWFNVLFLSFYWGGKSKRLFV